jgi:hypothetical protein
MTTPQEALINFYDELGAAIDAAAINIGVYQQSFAEELSQLSEAIQDIRDGYISLDLGSDAADQIWTAYNAIALQLGYTQDALRHSEEYYGRAKTDRNSSQAVSHLMTAQKLHSDALRDLGKERNKLRREIDKLERESKTSESQINKSIYLDFATERFAHIPSSHVQAFIDAYIDNVALRPRSDNSAEDIQLVTLGIYRFMAELVARSEIPLTDITSEGERGFDDVSTWQKTPAGHQEFIDAQNKFGQVFRDEGWIRSRDEVAEKLGQLIAELTTALDGRREPLTPNRPNDNGPETTPPTMPPPSV